jgi:hypothetical protein
VHISEGGHCTQPRRCSFPCICRVLVLIRVPFLVRVRAPHGHFRYGYSIHGYSLSSSIAHTYCKSIAVFGHEHAIVRYKYPAIHPLGEYPNVSVSPCTARVRVLSSVRVLFLVRFGWVLVWCVVSCLTFRSDRVVMASRACAAGVSYHARSFPGLLLLVPCVSFRSDRVVMVPCAFAAGLAYHARSFPGHLLLVSCVSFRSDRVVMAPRAFAAGLAYHARSLPGHLLSRRLHIAGLSACHAGRLSSRSEPSGWLTLPWVLVQHCMPAPPPAPPRWAPHRPLPQSRRVRLPHLVLAPVHVPLPLREAQTFHSTPIAVPWKHTGTNRKKASAALHSAILGRGQA